MKHHMQAFLALLSMAQLPAVAAPLPPSMHIARTQIIVPGGPGKFDWMTLDSRRQRLLAAHPGKGTLVLVNLRTGHLIKQIPVGTVSGVAVDSADSRYFAGTKHNLVTINSRNFRIERKIRLPGPADAIAFDPKNRKVYVDHDDGSEIWVIDANTGKMVSDINLPGVPEYIEYDPETNRLYQNIKSKNEIAVIDPGRNAVQAIWPSAPTISPHGLALDFHTHRLFTAGNGTLSALDMHTGKVFSTVRIAPGYVDQIAFDPMYKRIYSASSIGALAIVRETDAGCVLWGVVPVPKGTHSVMVDPRTHAAWISYSDGKNSYLSRLDVSDADTAGKRVFERLLP